jgi:integral membrane protein
MSSTVTDLRWLRLSGYAEGISFLVLLLIAMPLKYLAGQPMAVRVVGSLHGALFVIYAVMVLVAARNHRWPAKLIGLGLLAAFLPLGPFWFDRRIQQGD